MRLYAGLFVCGLGVIISLPATAAPRLYIDSARTSLLINAQAAILNDQFDISDSLADRTVAMNPSDPAGYITRAASMLARMTDAEENLFGDGFRKLLDTITSLCEKELMTADPPRKAWLYLFLGHAQAYRSLYESKFGSSYQAVRIGLRTRSSYAAGLERDSSLTDLYFGLGSYHYWKSVKAGLFRWIGLFHNDIQLGIDELRLAADSSLFSQDISRAALAWVWLDREKYDSVVAAVEPLITKYPSGKSFLWPLAKARFDAKDFGGAKAAYLRLRERLEANPGNYQNIIECDYYLAKCHEALSEPTLASAEATRIRDYEKYVPGHVRERQSDKIRYLKRLAESVAPAASAE
jgi:hypothetical protein